MKTIILTLLSFTLLFSTELTNKEKRKLAQKLNKKNYSILNIKKHNNLLIAVGEDISKTTSCEEDHYSLVLKSLDKGKTWKRVNEGSTLVPHLIHIENENTIIIGSSMEGTGGVVLVSHDSGKSWSEIYKDAMIETITKEKNLIRVRTLSTDIISKDGGKTWEEVPFRY